MSYSNSTATDRPRLYEPRREKTFFLYICDTKVTQISCAAIPLFPKYEISSSVAVQSGLRQTWSETPKTGFLALWLVHLSVCVFPGRCFSGIILHLIIIYTYTGI